MTFASLAVKGPIVSLEDVRHSPVFAWESNCSSLNIQDLSNLSQIAAQVDFDVTPWRDILSSGKLVVLKYLFTNTGLGSERAKQQIIIIIEDASLFMITKAVLEC